MPPLSAPLFATRDSSEEKPLLPRRPLLQSLLLCLAAAALAFAQPSVWTRLTQGPSDNLLEPALVRTKDGVLHVFWRTGGVKRDLMHSAFKPDGKLAGAATPVVSGWSSLSLPKAVIAAPDATLLVLFGGVLGGPRRDDPYNQGSLYSAASKDGGLTWELAPGAQSSSANIYSGYLAAAADREAKPVVAFTSSGKVLLQAGLGASQAVDTVRDGPCCAYHLKLAADGDSSEIWAAWHQNSAQDPGLYVRSVKPAMSAAAPVLVPGSQVNHGGKPVSPGPNQQLALSPRSGAPGVYLAYFTGYPAATGLKLWNVRGGEPLSVISQGGRQLWLTPGPEGRLWIFWNGAAAHSVSAIRSNKGLTRFSAPYTIGNPGGAAPIWHVVGEGSTGPLDAFVNGEVAGADKTATFHARLYPRLQLSGSPEGIKVMDLDDPVEGVEVTVGGQTIKSGANGLAAWKLSPGRPTPVKATHAAYAAEEAMIALPKPPEPKPAAAAKGGKK